MLKSLAALALAFATPAAAVPASAFYNSLGINAHAWYANNAWPSRLTELGIPNVRGKVGTSKDFVSKLQPFFDSGGTINATIVQTSGGTLDKAAAQKNLAFLKSSVGLSHVSGIEGPNEFNQGHPANWASTEREFVHWLHDTVRADSAFNDVPLIAPSVWKRLLADYQALGDLSAWVDRGCIHYYSGAKRPTLTGGNTMEGALRDASILAPGKPIRMTETGWQAPSGNVPVSLRAQAKYVLRNHFDAFGYGVEKVFIYQLMDDQTNLFGLTDANANPKPAFYALKNLAALFKDTPSSGTLGYSIGSAPAALKLFDFSKSDGSFLLVMYLDVDSYRNGKDIETQAQVTVNLAKPATSVELYEPTFSATPRALASGSSIAVTVSDQVAILKIR